MTTSYKKSRNKKILALCLSSFMLVGAAVSFAACGDGKDSSDDGSEVTTTEKDTARITNGSFEFYDDNSGRNLIITSPNGWSKSTNSSASGGSASSSKTASGIVDTSEEAWKNLTSASGKPTSTKAEAEANWNSYTARDKLAFYDTWLDADDDNKLEDLDFYDKEKDDFNISIDDVPDCDNPLTPYTETEKDKDEHVLMLHNSYTDGRGTAQKYTSSTTVTLEPGTSAFFSVWVKTMDMTYNGTSEEKGPKVDGERGAYIGVTHTVGGTTLDQMQIKNIDTEKLNPKPENGAWENNGWVEYTVNLKGCSYASSTFTIVLGLGQGGGTDKMEYVDGYAFFDDVQCSVVSNDTYDERVKDLPQDTIVDIFTDEEQRKFETDKGFADQFTYAIDLHTSFEPYTLKGTGKTLSTALTEETYNGVDYVSAPASGKTVYGDLKLSTKDDLTGYYTLDELNAKANSNNYVKNILKKDFENYHFEDKNVLMLLSAGGAAYTAKLEDSSTFTLQPDSYLMVSFWLKTSDIGGFTGAGVTVVETEGTNESSLSSLDTTSITTVDIDDLENEGEKIEDINNGWQQCFFFLQNETESEKSFSLSFTYGPTTIVGTTNNSYNPGYAAFANFETKEMTKKQFAYAATGTYAKSVSLVGDESTASAETAFDSAASIPDKQIENGIAIPKNYQGVNGGSGYVVAGGEDKEVNGYQYAGLINKKYAANYRKEYEKGDATYWLNKMAAAAQIAIDAEDKWWNTLFGTATQPLLVYSDEAKSYGYIGSSQTVSAGAYATVSVKVKVSAGAKAYLYLIDTSENKYADTLSFTTPKYSYWYDDDGNVCSKDPSDKKFDKKTDVAFYLNDKNGLYEANAKWSGYKAEMAGKYYANLSNYEKDDAGNLIVKRDSDGNPVNSYGYDESKWKHDGNDGIAFYYKDGKYYAYSNHTVEVTDLSSVSGLARYTNAEGTERNLMMVVDGNETDGEWVTCTFYIHTGNADKNYRLEVWSGDREGTVKNPKDSYVVFDANSPSAVDSTYADLVNETVEMIKNANDWTDDQFKENYGDVTYYAYSFFDSAEFLRYDSTLDKDEVGNKYTSYKSSAYSEGISYLYYEDEQTAKNNPLYTMFVDYSYTEVTVTADSTESGGDDGNEEETTNDTNMWLFISSLVIAIALIIAVVGLLIQKLVKKAHLKKARAGASNAASLNAAKRRYAKKEASEKKEAEQPKKEEPKDDGDPYND